ncbi:MAG: hypothetical protein GAK35_02649 [Herbaspirillum frisingense]|uniref:DUF4224 domain-containing protein n=1 Tax=Herbaspirillum frisingense TaxID=92645 RepID=A0A7V8JU17_9BURK|nr:MAG: hypothetical protein GAK35_02649 [Herbaspirillum frisingense]
MNVPSPFLSDEEILTIAEPLVQSAAIMRWFRKNGFVDLPRRPNGMPLVARAYFDAVVTSGLQKPAAPEAKRAQPNEEALRQRFGGRLRVAK